ncbi:MAG: TolC family protein [Candidatus Cloacimonadales bacterium]|nr:TolC family protein [Candidatus Cloacimonadales bacterium]
MKRILIIIMLCIPLILLNAITLEESIILAKQNNKEMLAEKSGFESAKWAKKNAFTNFLPKVTFNSRLVRIDDETYDQANEIGQIPVFNSGIPTGDYIPFSAAAMGSGFYKTTYTNDITVQQPIFNGGKVILGYQMAELARQQAELAVKNKEKDLTYAVASTYFGILKLQDLKILSEKSLNSTLSHLQTVLKKYEVGTAKKSDVLQWQVKMKNDETTIREIENSIKEITGYWQNLLGKAESDLPSKITRTEYDFEIADYTLKNDAEIDLAVDDFMQNVKKSSPTIQTLDIAKKLMQKNYKMAQGEFLPSLNLQYSYQIESDDKWNFDGEDNWNLAAVFSWPIFSSGTNYTNLKKARFDLKKTEYETQWAEENYLVAAENALQKLITKARIVEDNKTALEYARENHNIINNLFTQGLVTNTELLDAETMLFGSEMNLVSAYYDYILVKYEMQKYTK